MGWKSTISISRTEAVELLTKALRKASDQQLANALESIGYGDEPDWVYFGNNFRVIDTGCKDNTCCRRLDNGSF